MNLVYLQEEIEETRKAITETEKALEHLYEQIQRLEDKFQDECPHPQVFRKKHNYRGEEPGEADTVYYTCNICGYQFDENGE